MESVEEGTLPANTQLRTEAKSSWLEHRGRAFSLPLTATEIGSNLPQSSVNAVLGSGHAGAFWMQGDVSFAGTPPISPSGALQVGTGPATGELDSSAMAFLRLARGWSPATWRLGLEFLETDTAVANSPDEPCSCSRAAPPPVESESVDSTDAFLTMPCRGGRQKPWESEAGVSSKRISFCAFAGGAPGEEFKSVSIAERI
mmetsp:Transcript_39933/g.106726  ORF Transcript_39933/g.106726 Transcript_39933/m.106726 type:complete len:201 (-) Transcript_39933:1641-2243(-)